MNGYKFYANLFAKVFCYLEENDAKQDWCAVAIFPSRKEEPKHLTPYEDLLHSKRVRRIYLDELPLPPDASPGLGILHLVSAGREETKDLVHQIVKKTTSEYGDSESGRNVIQLAEELLIRKFSEMNREEVRKRFHLEDLRKTRVWQEAHEEGLEKGKLVARQEMIRNFLDQGLSHEQIAQWTKLPVDEVRRLAKSHSH